MQVPVRFGHKRLNRLSLNGMEAIKMVDITEIMDMLDWHMPSEIQSKGISLARYTETIIPFIQPLTPKHNKNVWENCAVIISERSDEEIKPHLPEMLEWLQDMNWPGAFCILNRLQKYSDENSLCNAINVCIKKAKKCRDEGKQLAFAFAQTVKAILKSKEFIPASIFFLGTKGNCWDKSEFLKISAVLLTRLAFAVSQRRCR